MVLHRLQLLCSRISKNRSSICSVRFNHHKWLRPEGVDSGIQIYNTITKCKEPLIFRDKHFVKWYICGPTVYDTAHIGHGSSYIRLDIIQRILENYFNIRPVVALGITDIDDKIIARSNALGIDFIALAKKYEIEFFDDMSKLNVKAPSFILRVTDHVPEIIKFVQKIIDNNQGYVAPDGSVYFNAKAFDNYGKLQPPVENSNTHLKLGQQHHLDFALWKGVKPGEPYWENPWGNGRPGWHIECSAMASKLFGAELDLHSGGVDLVFPHHENEEAQSCAFHGNQQWVNYWLHTGHLFMRNQKMSKSLHNYVTIPTFLETYTSDHLRMLCFVSHYRNGIDYSEETMRMPVALCSKIQSLLSDADAYVKGNWFIGEVSESDLLQSLQETAEDVQTALADNFNTPQSSNALQDLINLTIKMMHKPSETKGEETRCPAAVAAVANFVKQTYQSFGFQLGQTSEVVAVQEQHTLEFLVEKTVNFRSLVRGSALAATDKPLKQNLLKGCDSIRDELQTVGVLIKDQDNTNSSWTIVDNKT